MFTQLLINSIIAGSTYTLGRKNIQPLSESALNILARIRRLPRASQQEVFDALKKTFDA